MPHSACLLVVTDKPSLALSLAAAQATRKVRQTTENLAFRVAWPPTAYCAVLSAFATGHMRVAASRADACGGFMRGFVMVALGYDGSCAHRRVHQHDKLATTRNTNFGTHSPGPGSYSTARGHGPNVRLCKPTVASFSRGGLPPSSMSYVDCGVYKY